MRAAQVCSSPLPASKRRLRLHLRSVRCLTDDSNQRALRGKGKRKAQPRFTRVLNERFRGPVTGLILRAKPSAVKKNSDGKELAIAESRTLCSAVRARLCDPNRSGQLCLRVQVPNNLEGGSPHEAAEEKREPFSAKCRFGTKKRLIEVPAVVSNSACAAQFLHPG